MIRLTVYILCICIFLPIESIEVDSNMGKVRGQLVEDEITGACYYSFEGIPYAKPPVGDLRFQPPIRKEKWDDVFDATKPGMVCPQSELYYSKKEMDEDCLNLNIYTPTNRTIELLPVLFVIHGGDFDSQSGNAKPIYGPQLFMQQEIVVVTMNYRLGALGFLSLCNEEISGNAGLKDVLLALEIVYEIIDSFGGDPKKISLIGEGAGSAMAGLIMLIQRYNGIFRNVILHSSTFLNAKYTQIDPRENAMLLGHYLGLNMTNDDCMIEQLKTVDAFDIVEAQNAISLNDAQRGLRNFKPFKPTVEVQCETAVITEPLLKMMKEGKIIDVPVLLGFSTQEGLEMFPVLKEEPHLIDRFNEDAELMIPSSIRYPKGSEERKNLAKCIKDFYFNGENITFVNIQNYIDLMSDTQSTYTIDLFIKLFKEKKQSSIYYFVFSNDNELNWFKAFANITYPGAAHFDNVGYLFLTSITKQRYPYLDSNTRRVQESIMQIVTYFMNNGEPPASAGWPEAGKDRHHMYLNDYAPLPVYHSPLPKRIGFWSSVYDEYFNSTWVNATYFCTNSDVSAVQ